jgi:hypothetical protein
MVEAVIRIIGDGNSLQRPIPFIRCYSRRDIRRVRLYDDMALTYRTGGTNMGAHVIIVYDDKLRGSVPPQSLPCAFLIDPTDHISFISRVYAVSTTSHISGAP